MTSDLASTRNVFQCGLDYGGFITMCACTSAQSDSDMHGLIYERLARDLSLYIYTYKHAYIYTYEYESTYVSDLIWHACINLVTTEAYPFKV